MIIIIGSGLAGYTLVREIRKLNSDLLISLITQDNGDYYSKPQLSTALSYHKSPEQLVLIKAEKFAAQFNIQLFSHTNLKNLADISNILKYSDKADKIILATGASPISLANLDNFKKRYNIYAVNHLEHYKIFRQKLEEKNLKKKSVTIIGAGLVGCEFAHDLIQTGYNVTVISPDPYPLARLVPIEIGAALQQTLAEKGVSWQLNQFFDPEKFSQNYSCDSDNIILSATGLKPNIDLAVSAGIHTRIGITVDSYLKTSHADIYALGDCMEINQRHMPYIAPIAIGARALAQTLSGQPTPVIYPPMPIYIKTALYPIVVLQPVIENQASGRWHIEKQGNAVRALYYNSNQALSGFALGEKYASEASDWIKKITA